MTTIKNEFTVKSVALMTGTESEARVCPGVEKGIRFHFGGKSIEATIENVVSTEHCTVIGNAEIKIMLIEHFMAACALTGIDALDIYLSHYELPILNGGSKEWIDEFKKAQIEVSERKSYTIEEPIYYIKGKTHLVVLPSDKLNITYGVNFRHPELNGRWVSTDLTDRDEIAEARTFGYLAELEMLQKAGYGRGAKKENTLGLTETGYTDELKSEFEPIKHKILDLIGDFRLAECSVLDLNAEIIVKEAGHTVHTKVAKILKDKLIQEE